MRRYNQRIFRVIRSVVTIDDEAEDVLQEAWVRAYEHLDLFAGRASFSTWVTRIAFHEALARSRNSGRWTPLVNPGGEIMAEAERRQTTSETPERQAERDQLGRMLKAVVDALPETYRTVFVLREVEQLSTMETAECLELSEEAVKTRLHRSRALLRRDLRSRIGPAINPRVENQPNNLQTVLSLVEAGRGVSIVPACARNLRSNGVRFHRLQPDDVRVELVTTWEKSEPVGCPSRLSGVDRYKCGTDS